MLQALLLLFLTESNRAVARVTRGLSATKKHSSNEAPFCMAVRMRICVCVCVHWRPCLREVKGSLSSSHTATPQVRLPKSPSPVSLPACACVFKRHSLLDAPWCSLPVNKLNFGPYFAQCSHSWRAVWRPVKTPQPCVLTLIISSCQGQPSLPLLVKTCLLGMK